MKSLFSFLAMGGLMLAPLGAGAQTSPTQSEWQYRLLEGSTLVDDCLICGRPTILQPLRGSFRLVLLQDIPPFVRYELREMSFWVGNASNATYSVVGAGTYQISGEIAVFQDM